MNSINNNNGIGSILKDKIKDSSFTQKGLAEKANVSEASMSGYLNDEHPMPVAVFATIVKELGISADELLNGQEVEIPTTDKRKQATVSEVLDALVLLLETFDDAIEFEEFEQPMTTVALAPTKEMPSLFYSVPRKLMSFKIHSAEISNLVKKWSRAKQIIKEEDFNLEESEKEAFKDSLFFKEVRKYKRKYDTIQQGCFSEASSHPVLIKVDSNDIPFVFTDSHLTLLASSLSRKWTLDDYPDLHEVEVDNKFRQEFIYRTWCTPQSLDAAIEAKDLSLLEEELPF